MREMDVALHEEDQRHDLLLLDKVEHALVDSPLGYLQNIDESSEGPGGGTIPGD